MRLAIALVRGRWRAAVRIGFSSTVAATAEAALLLLIGLVAAALAAGDTDETTISLAGWTTHASVTSLLMVAVALVIVRTGTAFDTQRALARATAKYEAELREQLLGSFLRAGAREQDRHRVGELQDLALSDVQATASVLESALRVLPALVSFLLLLATAFAVSPAAALVILVAAAFLLVVLRPLGRRARAATERFSASRAAWAQELAQDQTLRHEIAVFGLVPWAERSSNRLLGVSRDDHEAGIRLSSMGLVLYQSASYLIAALLLLFFSTSGVRAGGFVAVVLLLVRGLSYSQALQQYLHIIEQQSGVLERVEATILSLKAAKTPVGSAVGLDWDALAFADVWFSYEPGRFAAAGVTFRAERGEMIGLIGTSGAGKSTLALLALGLFLPERGYVLVDGIPIQKVAADERARRSAFVPQEAVLFELSVYDNIALGRSDIDAAAVVQAAVRAGIHDEIGQLREGYHTVAAERGSRFSVGQRQRIAIARALAGNPSLIVFDEPTSALDPEAETAIQRALDELRRNAIVLVISHRRDSALRCDRVLYLREGCIVAEGRGAEMWELAGFGRQ
jgi:ABC-type multidrug transport system fused ATPase/permease subunit